MDEKHALWTKITRYGRKSGLMEENQASWKKIRTPKGPVGPDYSSFFRNTLALALSLGIAFVVGGDSTAKHITVECWAHQFFQQGPVPTNKTTRQRCLEDGSASGGLQQHETQLIGLRCIPEVY